MGLKVTSFWRASQPGFVNVDYFSVLDPDIKHDLNVFPWPFAPTRSTSSKPTTCSSISRSLRDHEGDPPRGRHGGRAAFAFPTFPAGSRIPITSADSMSACRCSSIRPSGRLCRGSFRAQAAPAALVRAALSQEISLPGIMYGFGTGVGAVCDFFANLSPYFCSRVLVLSRRRIRLDSLRADRRRRGCQGGCRARRQRPVMGAS